MPTAGTIMVPRSAVAVPPSRWKTCPAAWTVSTRHAMLNSVRCTGLPSRVFSVDWLQPLAAPTIMVACGPRRMSDAMSTTYETDMFDPPAMGKCTLNAAVKLEMSTRNRRGSTGENCARGMKATKTTAARTMTETMYQRARGGRSRSKELQV